MPFFLIQEAQRRVSNGDPLPKDMYNTVMKWSKVSPKAEDAPRVSYFLLWLEEMLDKINLDIQKYFEHFNFREKGKGRGKRNLSATVDGGKNQVNEAWKKKRRNCARS